MSLRRSPTLALAARIEQARQRGEPAWSLSTPTFPEPASLPAIDASWARLSPPLGLPALRDAAAERFFARWRLREHETFVAAGAKAALYSVLRAALQHGDRVLVPVPCWPSYFDLCAAAGVVGAAFETEPAADFALDLDRLAAEAEAQDAKAVMLSNPCNPTGRILRAREVEGLAEICRARGMLLIVDQSFSGVIFDAAGWARSVAPAFDRLVLVDSFSKNYLLQGARVAAVAAPSWLVESAATVHQTIASAAPTPGQRLALHALKTNDAMPSLDAQRAMAAAFIARKGWRRHDQGGTFYFFPEVEDIDAFTRHAAARNVFLLSGEAFGPRYANHFRFCFCKPEEELAAILNLLDEPPNDA